MPELSHQRVVQFTCRSSFQAAFARFARDIRATHRRPERRTRDAHATRARRTRDAPRPARGAPPPARDARATRATHARRTRDARATHARRTRDPVRPDGPPGCSVERPSARRACAVHEWRRFRPLLRWDRRGPPTQRSRFSGGAGIDRLVPLLSSPPICCPSPSPSLFPHRPSLPPLPHRPPSPRLLSPSSPLRRTLYPPHHIIFLVTDTGWETTQLRVSLRVTLVRSLLSPFVISCLLQRWPTPYAVAEPLASRLSPPSWRSPARSNHGNPRDPPLLDRRRAARRQCYNARPSCYNARPCVECPGLCG